MFKDTILTLCIFLLALSALQSQNKWELGFHYTPSLAKPVFDDKKTGTGEARLSHEIGLDVYRRFSENLEFKTGIVYRNVQFRQELDVGIPAYSCYDIFTAPAGLYPVRYNDEYSNHYIGIPLEVKFFFTPKKKNLYAKGGIETLVLVKTKSKSEIVADQSCPTPHSLKLNYFSYTASLGMGYEFALFSKIKLLIEPSFGFALNKVFNIPDISTVYEINNVRNNVQIFDFGLMLGMKF